MSDLDDLYDELKELHQPEQESSSRSHRVERIIAGFEDIVRFFEQNNRLPHHGEDREIFERLYAVRLEQIRNSEECRSALTGLDEHGLLDDKPNDEGGCQDEIDEDELIAELGDVNITDLKHVRPRAEINAAEEIATRTPCHDFHKFKPLFEAVSKDVSNGSRLTRQIRKEASFLKLQIKVGNFFVLYGQTVYVAEIGEPIKGSNDSFDARMRVIYSNGTESNMLLDSLRRGLHKDEASRIISEPSAGPLFTGNVEVGDVTSGTIYVLRSRSEHPMIQEHRDVIHKIGVTSGDVQKRIANAKLDPTFLMADVEIVATYELCNIIRSKLENLLHRFFEPARLKIEIKDRFGLPIVPREWFLVPLFVIDDVIERIKDGSIVNCSYDATKQAIIQNKK